MCDKRKAGSDKQSLHENMYIYISGRSVNLGWTGLCQLDRDSAERGVKKCGAERRLGGRV
jgi:hypothetical protein